MARRPEFGDGSAAGRGPTAPARPLELRRALAAAAALAALVGLPALGAWAGPPRRYQGSPVFAITLDRVDPDAQEVALEVYDRTSREWRRAGAFSLRREAGRTLGGSATFRAPAEGEHFLRARARDAAGNADPRGDDPDSADIVAVYDATPPVVEIVSPTRAQVLQPGAELMLSWRTREANPAPAGAASVEVSTDGGRSWRTLASGLDDTGSFVFRAGESGGDALVRIAVRDRAGNRGEAVAPAISIEAAPAAPPQAAPAPVAARAEPGPAAARGRNAHELYREGASALAARELVKAQKLLREAVAAEPDLEAAWLDLSAALALGGEFGRGREVLERAERKWPSSAAFPYNLGLVLVRMGRPREAVAALERACRLDPDRYEARWVLALLALDSGDLELARSHWREVARAAPESSPLRERSLQYLAASEP